MKKKIFVIVSCVICAALALLGLFFEPWKTVRMPSEETVISGAKLKDANCVRWIGRTHYDDGQMYCYHTATGFTVKFTGTQLKVSFRATNTNSDKNRPYFIASVDDQTAPSGKNFCLTEDEQTVTVAENLPDGTHTVTVLKRSEPENSLTSVVGIRTDGEFKKPQAHTGLKFQILGGSGITGHGCLGQSGESWTTANSSSLNAFGYLAAKAFGAETQFVSGSGMGLVWSYRGDNLTTAYEAAGMVAEYNADGSTKAVKAVGSWNHESWTPDVIIANIGGNDWNSHINNPEELPPAERPQAEAQFKQAVKDLLTRIHTLYPGAKVVWTCNSVSSGNGALASAAVAELQFKENIKLVEIDNSKDGADNHASSATQAKNAKTVADAITSAFAIAQAE